MIVWKIERFKNDKWETITYIHYDYYSRTHALNHAKTFKHVRKKMYGYSCDAQIFLWN